MTHALTLTSDYAQWWRYDVYIMAVDDAGNFTNLVSKGTPDTPRDISLTLSGPNDLYIYIVANTAPSSVIIADAPPFTAVLKVNSQTTILTVDQLGGLATTLKI